MTVEHNIAVQTESAGSPQRFVLGECSGSCRFDYNVSDDSSSDQGGSTHFLTGWSPVWTGTVWDPGSESSPPKGYYLPGGLGIAAGYEGNALP